jgi:hypothetical protein
VPPSTPTPETQVDREARLSPRTIALAGLALAITFLVAAILDRRISTDVFWQMAAGQWMLAHHAVIGLDPFSYTESHRHWVSTEWGSEVILASLYKVVGAAAYNLIAIFTGSLCLICTMLYARALGARGGRLAAIVLVLAMGIVGYVGQDRGLSFSLIWLPLELLILTKARTNQRLLWWLPPLCLLWVNTHGSILVGLAVLAAELGWSLAPTVLVERLGGRGRSPFPARLALIGLISLGAACISPYGPRLLTYDLSVAHNPQIGKYIEEWQSPNFGSIVVVATFLIFLAVIVVALRRRPIMLLEATVTLACLVGALHAVRIVIYAMVGVAGLAASLPPRAEWGPRARRIAGALGIAAVLFLVILPAVPAGSVTTDTPVAAFNYLSDHPGRIFTQYSWEDYAIARHRQTFADGRTDLFSGQVLTEFFAVSDLTTDPDPILAHYDVRYVLWARNTPLEKYLSHDSRWVVVDRTVQGVVFERR